MKTTSVDATDTNSTELMSFTSSIEGHVNTNTQCTNPSLKLQANAWLEAIENALIIAGPKYEERINTETLQFYIDNLRDVHNKAFSK